MNGLDTNAAFGMHVQCVPDKNIIKQLDTILCHLNNSIGLYISAASHCKLEITKSSTKSFVLVRWDRNITISMLPAKAKGKKPLWLLWQHSAVELTETHNTPKLCFLLLKDPFH